MGKKHADETRPPKQPHTFPQACVDAAISYWLGKDASHQYAFKGPNSHLFNQMLGDPEVAARANEIFGGSAPTSTTDGQTTTGEPIHWATEPTFTCP